jgi:hypothetical protein
MINAMRTTHNIQIMAFISKLKEVGVSCYPDTEKRTDGKALENYVFEKDGKTMKLINGIIHKEFGRVMSSSEYYAHLIYIITLKLKQ